MRLRRYRTTQSNDSKPRKLKMQRKKLPPSAGYVVNKGTRNNDVHYLGEVIMRYNAEHLRLKFAIIYVGKREKVLERGRVAADEEAAVDVVGFLPLDFFQKNMARNEGITSTLKFTRLAT
ncbi:hypothetical protein Salat_1696400 [Sesamum alatum]|uniref:Uncharacterized protein n=1 Tax=Sesamum alatum TaxID=300844 RepID=A0AAE2CK09_9LAMI|nr:hypothetical protein Salat_1696400 [Sesamum alatum]